MKLSLACPLSSPRVFGVLWNASMTALLGLASSCASKQEQLEEVAKDWCLTIRASQVMPVYPLTQDLQPGDVFLVQLPIDRQQKAWRDKGYLPLDNHLARLDPERYADFYSHSFPFASDDQLPLAHLNSTPAWDRAPHAGFPTYSFSVRKGGGLNLALPVSSVPVGLGLLGAEAAEGTVSIGKARTLGIDILSLHEQLRAWAAQDDSRRFLAGLASVGTRKNYVRVVTRIYLTGELDVSLRDTSQRGAGVDVGVPSPVAMLVPKVAQTPAGSPQAAADGYSDAIDRLNEMLRQHEDRYTTDPSGAKQFSAGGSLRLTSASARAISMKEIFDPPLVLGYLGFDCEIGPGGSLGPAVPTHALVSGALGGEAFVSTRPIARAYLDQFWLSSYQVALQRAELDATARRVVLELDGLAQLVPANWRVWKRLGPTLEQRTASLPADARGSYEAYRQWRAKLQSSAKALAETLDDLPAEWQRSADSTVSVERGSTEAADLAAELAALQAQLDNPELETRHAEARRALADWMFANLYASREN